MVELRFLKGSQAGRRWSARHFPFKVGRKQSCDCVIEDSGVWEEHLEIAHDAASGFYVTSLSEGSVIVNQHPAESAILKSGDTITLGSAAVQFWLTPARQKQFRVSEIALWLTLLGLCAGEIALIRWLN